MSKKDFSRRYALHRLGLKRSLATLKKTVDRSSDPEAELAFDFVASTLKKLDPLVVDRYIKSGRRSGDTLLRQAQKHNKIRECAAKIRRNGNPKIGLAAAVKRHLNASFHVDTIRRIIKNDNTT